jgi:hypothetical protein
MNHNSFQKSQITLEVAFLIFIGIAAIAADPGRTADADATGKEVMVSPAEKGAGEVSPAIGNAEEDEFARFTDFFIPVMPVKEVVEPVQTNQEEEAASINVTLPSMTVTGIVWGTKQPRAIIDGEVYGEGDIVANTEAKIKKIDEAGILFLYKKKEFLMKRSKLLGIGEGT